MLLNFQIFRMWCCIDGQVLSSGWKDCIAFEKMDIYFEIMKVSCCFFLVLWVHSILNTVFKTVAHSLQNYSLPNIA
jgi:hypothetical protein